MHESESNNLLISGYFPLSDNTSKHYSASRSNKSLFKTKYAAFAAILNHFFESRQKKSFIERTRNDIDCVMAKENLFTISILFISLLRQRRNHLRTCIGIASLACAHTQPHRQKKTLRWHLFLAHFSLRSRWSLSCVFEIYESVCVCLAVIPYESRREPRLWKGPFSANPIQNKFCIRIGNWYRLRYAPSIDLTTETFNLALIP